MPARCSFRISAACRPRSPAGPAVCRSAGHEPSQPEFVPAESPFRTRRKRRAGRPSLDRPASSGPAPRSATRSRRRDAPVPAASPADPSPTGPSDPVATPAPHRSPGGARLPAVSRGLPAALAPEPTSRTCMAMVQPRRAAYSRMARFCIGRVCWSFVETRAYRPARNIFAGFRRLAKNVLGFCVCGGPFGGHFERSPRHGRRRSFSARKELSYYAAAGVASRASVSR